MRAIVTSTFLSLSFLFLNLHPVLADDIEDAVQAYSMAQYDKAIKLVRPLADAGNADAQYLLGMAYMDGNGVSRDLVESYKWFELVVRSGDPSAELDRDDVASQLKPDQLTEARKRADDWSPQ